MSFIKFILFVLLISCEENAGLFGALGGKDNTNDINQIFKNQRKEKEDNSKCAQNLLWARPKSNISEFLGDLSQLSCESMCPLNDVNVIEQTEAEKELGFLSFNNFSEFEGFWKKGQCRGHTIVTQKFNSLGVYCNDLSKNCSKSNSKSCQRKRVCESDEKFKNGSSCHPDDLSSHCSKFYSNIIKDIAAGKLRAIPGFRSLAEFSSHPRYVDYFKYQVRKYRASFSADKANVTTYTGNYMLDTLKEVEKRISKKFTPYLGIKGISSSGLGNHAVSVYDVKNENGIEKFCVRDSNAPRLTRDKKIILNNCQNYIYSDGLHVYYHPVSGKNVELTKMQMYSDEDDRTIQYAKEYQGTCERIKSNANSCVTDGVSDNVHFKIKS